MTAELTATVDNGVLRPDAVLPFPDRTRVKVTIETIAPVEDPATAWEALKARIRLRPVHAGGKHFTGTSSMNAVDTNVFVYALDADEPLKQGKAQQLLDRLVPRRGETELLWQVAREFLSCLRKWHAAGRMSAGDVESNFRDVLASFPLRLPAASMFTASFNLCSRYSLSHWDSLLIAACKEAGINLLYSEDLDSGTDYDGVRIVNPFV